MTATAFPLLGTYCSLLLVLAAVVAVTVDLVVANVVSQDIPLASPQI